MEARRLAAKTTMEVDVTGLTMGLTPGGTGLVRIEPRRIREIILTVTMAIRPLPLPAHPDGPRHPLDIQGSVPDFRHRHHPLMAAAAEAAAAVVVVVMDMGEAMAAVMEDNTVAYIRRHRHHLTMANTTGCPRCMVDTAGMADVIGIDGRTKTAGVIEGGETIDRPDTTHTTCSLAMLFMLTSMTYSSFVNGMIGPSFVFIYISYCGLPMVAPIWARNFGILASNIGMFKYHNAHHHEYSIPIVPFPKCNQ